MEESVFQRQQIASTDLNLLIGQTYSSSALKQLNRHPAIYMMLIHFRAGLHKDKDDMKIGILRECPGTAARASLPRLLVSQFPKLISEMKLQRGSRQER